MFCKNLEEMDLNRTKDQLNLFGFVLFITVQLNRTIYYFTLCMEKDVHSDIPDHLGLLKVKSGT